ncbi:MAG: hypothetical protein IJN48_00910, partial [Clostridia bacterium]|nr:hypothetical protein [Clostridia bacterium]
MVKTKRFLGVLLTLIMLIGLFAITSSAAEQSNTADIASGNITLTETDGVKYANNTAYGDVITIIDSDTAEANVLTIQSGEHDVIIDTVTAKQIDIAAGAKLNLTLTGESTITLTESTMAAIHVPEGAELVITENSQGSVTVSADENVLAGHSGNGAGIGGNKSENNGKITIHGGTVTATGGLGAAGIGGGWEASGANIIITGGIVTATGGSSAAGIGGGSTKDGTNITITGGIVTAIGSNDSSGGDFGIGGGGPESAVSESGAGIGGGYSGRGVDITISGGTVIATSETSVGIGGGNNGSMENIFISPEEYSAITVKETEDATEIIGKYTQETDVTAEFKGISAVYMYTTTCGGNHVDEDGDHKCDICDAYIDELHTDED